MAYVKNKGNKTIVMKFAWDGEEIVIEPNSEVSIPDIYAQMFLGFELNNDQQLIECVNRLKVLGNDIDLQYLKENIEVKDTVVTKRSKG